MPIIEIAAGNMGLVRDIPAHRLPPEVFSDVLNMRFVDGAVERMLGDNQVYGTLLDTPEYLKSFPPIATPVWLYGNDTRVYAVQGGTHAEITDTVTFPIGMGGQNNQRPNTGILNGIGYFNNINDVPQQWTPIAVSQDLAGLANWPSTLRCNALRSFKNFLIAIRTQDTGVDQPFNIRWSSPAVPGAVPPSWDIADPTQEAGERDLADTDDYVVDGLRLGNVFMVYKERSTIGMAFIGQPSIFQTATILEADGILHRDCAANFPGGHFVVTKNDIIVHTGQRGSSQSLIKSRLRKWLFKQIDSDNFFNSYVVTNYPKHEVWFCFPEAGDTYARTALVWNWDNQTIGIRQLDQTKFADAGPVNDVAVSQSWDADTESWDSDVSAWGGQELELSAFRPVLLQGAQFQQTDVTDKMGTAAADYTSFVERTGLAIAGRDRQGAPIVDPSIVKLVRGVYPLIEAPPGTVIKTRLGMQDDLSAAIRWLPESNFIVGQDSFTDGIISGRYAAVRFSTTAGVTWKLTGYSLDIEPLGAF